MKKTLSVTAACLLVLCGAGFIRANNATSGEGENIMISPNTLVLSSAVGCVSVHSNIPCSAVVSDSVALSVALEGIDPYLIKADSLGHLVAKFAVEDVENIVEPGQVTLTLTGVFLDGRTFSASDTITVRP